MPFTPLKQFLKEICKTGFKLPWNNGLYTVEQMVYSNLPVLGDMPSTIVLSITYKVPVDCVRFANSQLYIFYL